jgi:hypothetical protein
MSVHKFRPHGSTFHRYAIWSLVLLLIVLMVAGMLFGTLDTGRHFVSAIVSVAGILFIYAMWFGSKSISLVARSAFYELNGQYLVRREKGFPEQSVDLAHLTSAVRIGNSVFLRDEYQGALGIDQRVEGFEDIERRFSTPVQRRSNPLLFYVLVPYLLALILLPIAFVNRRSSLLALCWLILVIFPMLARGVYALFRTKSAEERERER